MRTDQWLRRVGEVRRAASFMRDDRWQIAAYLAALLVTAVLNVLPPLLFGRLIDSGISAGDQSAIQLLGGLAVGVAAISAVLTVVSRWLAGRVSENMTYRARVRVFEHVRRLPLSFATHSDTGAVMNRILNDVAGIQAVTASATTLLASGATAGAVLVAMFSIDWHVTLLALGLFPMFYGPARIATAKMSLQHQERMNAAAAVGSLTTEMVSSSGSLLSRLFSDPSRDTSLFTARAARLRDAGVRLVLLNGLFLGALGLMVAVGTASIFWIGGLGVTTGALTVGGLVAVATLSIQLYAQLTQLAGTPVNLTAAVVSLSRSFEVLDLQLQRQGNRRLESVRGRVSFHRVEFTYPSRETSSVPSLQLAQVRDPEPEQPVLKGVTLAIEPGQTVALVGHSGAGKSTLALLLAGVYQATRGQVRLDDIDVTELSPETLTSAIGVVSQDTYLLHDSVLANLKYAAPDAAMSEITAACAAAGIHDFLARLPNGYETIVGAQGYRLSGGQKQRLSLARVLLKAPPVVVLDEATAHLDAETEREVRDTVSAHCRSATKIVIAHRLSAIVDADAIAVLQEGAIVEIGTHARLLANRGTYARLYAAQVIPTHGAAADEPSATDEVRVTDGEPVSLP